MPRSNGATVVANEQRAFDERPLENPAIEEALDRWQDMKEQEAAAKQETQASVEFLQEAVSNATLEPGKYRIGSYILNVEDIAAHQRIKPRLNKRAKK